MIRLCAHVVRTADDAEGLGVGGREKAVRLAVAARESVDTLAAENARLHAVLLAIVDVSNEPLRGQDPWHVVGQMGGMAEGALMSAEPAASSMWTTPVAADRPPLENAKLDPTVTREEMQEIARKAEASAFKPRPISDELLRMPLDGPLRRACPCCGGKSPYSRLCALCRATP